MSLSRIFNRKMGFQLVVLLVVFLILVGTALLVLPFGSDWNQGYRPALNLIWAGQSPYSQNAVSDHPIVNPPWILLPLLPIALLPPQVGRALIFAFTILIYTGVAIRLGARPFGVLAFLLSYPVVYDLVYGQIDSLVAIGFVLPPTTALFFVLAKPQIGIGVAVFWLVESWRSGGWRNMVRVFWPVTLAFFICFLIFGNWFAYAYHPLSCECNTSLWPRSLPIGLVLLVTAIKQRQSRWAMASSPFFAPYVPPHSWAVALLSVVSDTRMMALVSASSWVVWVLGGGSAGR